MPPHLTRNHSSALGEMWDQKVPIFQRWCAVCENDSQCRETLLVAVSTKLEELDSYTPLQQLGTQHYLHLLTSDIAVEMRIARNYQRFARLEEAGVETRGTTCSVTVTDGKPICAWIACWNFALLA